MLFLFQLFFNLYQGILNSLDKISDNLYGNDLITKEYPFFVESKEMIECLLMDPIYESEEYLNLAITLFSDFFTLLEVKLLLFDGCNIELEAPEHVLREYDKELLRRFYTSRGYADFTVHSAVAELSEDQKSFISKC